MDTAVTTAGLEQALDALGRRLLDRGLCDRRMLDRAGRVAAETGQRLDAALIQLGLLSERGLAEAYAELLPAAIATPARYPAAPLFADRLARRFLRASRAVPVAVEGGRLVVACADPLDPFIPAAIAAATGLPVTVEVALPIEAEAALERLYADTAPAPEAIASAEADAPLAEDAERLRDLASEAPVIRLVNQIIGRAVETQASDIHIEPFEDRLRVRFRYDGVLQEANAPPARLAAAITSRIKIMAKLDIAERRLPQDGRIRLSVRGQEVDFRVSTIPSLHGETVVLRVLDRTAVAFDFAQLGLAAPVVARLRGALELPNGIMLVTGPTGSGKTTTLYSALLALNSEARKVVTVEDPIEYQLAGVNQIQVKPQIGLNFAALLRSILRQDPDVIMVGEIRDLETAQIAAQAALTGHLVLSTLHTNSAAASVTRLRDMGLEDYLLTAVLRGVLAQRLVRKLCPGCRRAAPAPDELVQRLGLAPRDGESRPLLWHAAGCPHCRSTGDRGRLAIAEYLHPDAGIERLIFARADQSEIERAAVAAGMTTMLRAGLDAAAAGITTVEEVMRSLRANAGVDAGADA